MNRKFLIGSIVLGLVFVLGSLGVFVVREVGGFDLFGSKSTGCAPYNVFITEGEENYSVEIEWSTKDKCFGFVQYGSDSNDMKLIGVDLADNSQSKEHRVVLKSILSTERYYFLINSDDQEYGLNGIPLEFVFKDL